MKTGLGEGQGRAFDFCFGFAGANLQPRWSMAPTSMQVHVDGSRYGAATCSLLQLALPPEPSGEGAAGSANCT